MLLVFGAIIGTVLFGADEPAPSNPVRAPQWVIDIPASQILVVGELILRIDTTTGALYVLEGDLTISNAQNAWKRRVPGPEQPNSGTFLFQALTYGRLTVPLLCDAVTGQTWILKSPGTYEGTWELVEPE
jgi:hypothetical protein